MTHFSLGLCLATLFIMLQNSAIALFPAFILVLISAHPAIHSPHNANLKSDHHLLSWSKQRVHRHHLSSVVFPHYQAKTANPFNSYLLRSPVPCLAWRSCWESHTGAESMKRGNNQFVEQPSTLPRSRSTWSIYLAR